MIHRSELSGLTKKKLIPLKMVRYKDWIENELKSGQRKTLKDLQNVWRTIAQDHFKRLQESHKEMRAGSGLLYGTVNQKNTLSIQSVDVMH